jgi:hypothetical protein
MMPELRHCGATDTLGPCDTTRQLMVMLADCIREAGYTLGSSSLIDEHSGQILHAYAAAHRQTGEVWCVTAPDDFEAMAELVRQIDLECETHSA